MCSLRMDGIAVHAAVAAGEACFGVLGGYEDMWTYVMSSPCSMDMRECMNATGAYDVVIDAAMYTTWKAMLDANFCMNDDELGVVKAVSRRSEKGAPIPSLPCISLTSSMKHRFVPIPIMTRGGKMESVLEVRVITSLFLRLDSYNTSQHRDIVTLQPFYIAMQEIIFEYGGFIRQFLIDDKGCVLIVLWGVPGASFPNNCCRAVHCAADMVRKTNFMNHRCSIGISTGTAYCGPVGSSVRKDYVAMSKMVNFAARLMMAARGRILLDASTRECLPIEVRRMAEEDYTSAVDVSTTGNVFALLSSANRYRLISTSDVPLMFPTASIEVLRALDKAVATSTRLQHLCSSGSTAQWVIVKGSEGCGKTCILQKFCRDAEVAQVRVLPVQLTQQHLYSPRLLLRDMLEFLMAMTDTLSYDELLSPEFMQEMFSQDNASLNTEYRARLFFDDIVIRSSPSRSRRIYPLSIHTYHDTVATVLIHLLRKLDVTAVVIDGGEYITETSLQPLLHAMAKGLAVVVVIGLTVPTLSPDDTMQFNPWLLHANTNAMLELASKGCVETHTLAPLSLTCVGCICGGTSLDVVNTIYDTSKGNAFWTFWLTRRMFDCGVSEYLSELESHNGESMLATLLLSKYTMQQCSIIKIAALFGVEFNESVLVKVLPAALQWELQQTLTVFVRSGLLFCTEHRNYRFQNSLVQEAIRQLIPTRIALAVAASTDVLSDPQKSNMLAYHFSHAGSNYSRHALKYAMSSSSQYFQLGCYAVGVYCASLGLRVATTRTDCKMLIKALDDAESDVDTTMIGHYTSALLIRDMKEKVVLKYATADIALPRRRRWNVWSNCLNWLSDWLLTELLKE